MVRLGVLVDQPAQFGHRLAGGAESVFVQVRQGQADENVLAGGEPRRRSAERLQLRHGLASGRRGSRPAAPRVGGWR